ncbi:beta propeller repeat protein [Burkholderia anthina]|uniref:hypothetical protein n=1 Tax=Burkholderia anthina TaxID=179879 RepID=UPI00299F272B|nr:hypothetical protein [Burkholderia anthina]
MAHLFFAASIQRHIDVPERDIDARTLGEAHFIGDPVSISCGGVWQTFDGGATWRQVSAHLPPAYCVRFG